LALQGAVKRAMPQSRKVGAKFKAVSKIQAVAVAKQYDEHSTLNYKIHEPLQIDMRLHLQLNRSCQGGTTRS